jgi:peptide deformylase
MGRVLQHEFQHLNGKLLIDQLGRRERKKALKELSEKALGIV